jgi:LmbE family N-acetylglucosaminyl deacetylase
VAAGSAGRDRAGWDETRADARVTDVFLAPHYDDVALSCGGTVAALAGRGTPPLVITIFGGEPTANDLTAFARWQHERWGTGEADTVATRLDEELAAAAALGCATATLPFLDAIYRGEAYLSDEALFGAVDPADAALPGQIAGALLALPALAAAEPPAVNLFVPLAIGNHVDHQIVYAVGRMLAARGWRVSAYEDFPYAVLGTATARRLADVGAEIGAAETRPVATLARRVAAIGAYRSQLPVIFRFTDDWPGVIAAHAFALGAGQGAMERFWPLGGTKVQASPAGRNRPD